MIKAEDMSKNFLQSLGLNTSFLCNSRHLQIPNLWLFWKVSLTTPTIFHCSPQQLTVEVEGTLITIVHAHCIYVQRRHLWAELQIISSSNLPWMVMGDFNAYLSYGDKKGGNRPSSAAMNDFREYQLLSSDGSTVSRISPYLVE
ncbi:hypothetical protein IFM89_012760 [Coptis chinensis]|uniref:Endonuclease/exonuclease/phosphatase domain-containing protein n=1 Tax=Coptis chinensis TaxID=261450 RepID=A0A835HE11_9MAGN|nr:hypothetical protein IFM89_012760 [Coptis chinensis]